MLFSTQVVIVVEVGVELGNSWLNCVIHVFLTNCGKFAQHTQIFSGNQETEIDHYFNIPAPTC